MHDGFVNTLTKVMHVPSLKRNLIFVSVLNESGLSCKAKNCTM